MATMASGSKARTRERTQRRCHQSVTQTRSSPRRAVLPASSRLVHGRVPSESSRDAQVEAAEDFRSGDGHLVLKGLPDGLSAG